MPLTFHWFLPTSGDSRHLGDIAGRRDAGYAVGRQLRGRRVGIDYLAQIARAAEHLGFSGVLTPTGTWCEDAWLVTAALTRETERLKFLVAFRPGALSPTLAAQMAATYQRLSHGRLLLNVVTGGDGAEQRRFGDFVGHDERYQRTDEFLSIVRGIWRGEPFDFQGDYYTVEGAAVSVPPDPVPRLYFGGSSEAAGPVAAKHADVYLTWGEPLSQVSGKLAWIRGLATSAGRSPHFGIRLHVISRDTNEAAWHEASRLLETVSPEDVAVAQQRLRSSESVGQARMLALHQGSANALHDPRQLEISPNLWAGVGLVRGGAGTALVGSHAEVAARISEYAELGITEFVLSGYPHLEEAYWFGEGVLPLLRARHAVESPATRVEVGAVT